MNLPSSWKELPSWLRITQFYKKDLDKGGPMEATTPDKGNLLSSYLYTKGNETYHLPVLDIDMPVWVNESTTPGHYHLAIDKHLTAEQYDKLLRVLVEVGIVQQGIIDLQWEADGLTAIRVPGEKKSKNSQSSGKKVAKNSSYTMTTTGDIQITMPKANQKAPTFEEIQAEVKKVQSTLAKHENAVATTSGNWVTVNSGTINAATLPAQTVKVPTLIEQETIDKWTTEFMPAILTYEKLVELASKTSTPVKEVLDGWAHLVNVFTSENKNATAEKPSMEW